MRSDYIAILTLFQFQWLKISSNLVRLGYVRLSTREEKFQIMRKSLKVLQVHLEDLKTNAENMPHTNLGKDWSTRFSKLLDTLDKEDLSLANFLHVVINNFIDLRFFIEIIFYSTLS
jgi:hypothetical protein